jgi:hypothetical protein
MKIDLRLISCEGMDCIRLDQQRVCPGTPEVTGTESLNLCSE